MMADDDAFKENDQKHERHSLGDTVALRNGKGWKRPARANLLWESTMPTSGRQAQPSSTQTRKQERWARGPAPHRPWRARGDAYPGQHLVRDWPVLDRASSPRSTGALAPDGRCLIENKLDWSWTEFMSAAAVPRPVRHPLRHPRVALRQSMGRSQRQAHTRVGEAAGHGRFIVFHSYDDYTRTCRRRFR